MCKHVFITDECYSGEYVATSSFSDKKVIAHGPDPVAVLEESEKKGISDPVLIFVPKKDATYVY